MIGAIKTNKKEEKMKNKDWKKLPKAEYFKEIQCPNCGWHEGNDKDVSATFHKKIERKYTEERDSYYHCTSCGTDFRGDNEPQWRETIYEFLADLHPVRITEGIIKPAIEQLIDDYEDSLGLYDEDEKEEIEGTKQVIAFWKKIKKQIENE